MVDVLTPELLAQLTADELGEYYELLRAQEIVAQLTWELSPRQQYAYDLADTVDELFYGGAAGGGKTELGLYRCWRKSVEIPNHRTLYLRRSFPELRRTVIPRSQQRFKEHKGVKPVWRAADKEWHFSNGAIIELGYVDGDHTVAQYDSAEYDMLVVDEASEFSEYEIKFIIGRLRTTVFKRAAGARPHCLLMSNPGGIGHVHLRKKFVLPSDYGLSLFSWEALEGDPESVRHGAFVPAKVDDNPYIDPDYVRNLKQLDEKLRRQRLDGDWDTFDGQYFAEFSTLTHVVDPFEIPAGWRKIRCLDYGFSAPAVCLWLAFDYDDNCYVYREWTGTNLTPAEQAQQILAAETGNETIDHTVADPSIWRATTTRSSIADQYKKAGMRCVEGENERVAGWLNVREWLRVRNDQDGPSVAGAPSLYVFRHCTRLCSTFPELIHDKKRPDDLDTRGPDHWLDALRYGLMSKRRRSRKPLKQQTYDHLDRASQYALEHLRSFDRKATGQRHSDLGDI